MRTILGRFTIPAALMLLGCLVGKWGGATPWWTTCGAPVGPTSELALGAALLVGRPKRKPMAQRAAAACNSGQRLSGGRTPKEAAQIILDAADSLSLTESSEQLRLALAAG